MSDQHFALPDHLADFVHEQVAAGGFAGVGEYFVQLVESERRRKAMARLEAELLERVESQPKVVMTSDDWAAIRRECERRLRESGRI